MTSVGRCGVSGRYFQFVSPNCSPASLNPGVMPCEEETCDSGYTSPVVRRLMMDEERTNKMGGSRKLNGDISTVRVKATTTEGLVRQRASKFTVSQCSRSFEDDVDSTTLSRNSSVSPPLRPDTPKILELDAEPRTTVTRAVIETPPHQKNVSFEKDRIQTSSGIREDIDSSLLPGLTSASVLTPPKPNQEKLFVAPEEPCRKETVPYRLEAVPDSMPTVPVSEGERKQTPPPSRPGPLPIEPFAMDTKPPQNQDDSCIIDCLYFTMQCCECTIM